MSYRILIPSAGNRMLLIRAFRDLPNVEKVVTTEIDPLAPGLFSADKHYFVPRSLDEGYLLAIEDICKKEQINLLMPLSDLDVIRYCGEKERFAAMGIPVLTSPKSTIDTCMDKWRTAEVLESINIPIPKTWLLTDVKTCLDTLDFPIYLKPRFCSMKSTSSYFFQLIQTRADLEFFLRKLENQTENYLVQEYLRPGKEINVDFFVQDGELKRIVTLYRLKAGDGGGIIRGQTIPCNPQIKEIAETMCKHIPFYGATNFQVFAFDDGRLMVTEINPRFSNSSALCVKPSGVDFYSLSLDLLDNKSIEPAFDNYKIISVTSSYEPIIVEGNPYEDQS